MVTCPKCALNNTLDSAFCRKCGYSLPQDLIIEGQDKLKELVSKGMNAFSDGNTDEAMGVAEHAVIANPAYADAHALKGMVHERRAEYAQALDCFETVVALNPDSTIDKIKLNQLRNAFAQRTAEPKVDRKSAGLMALAATLLVASIGAITFRVATSSTSTTSTLPVGANQIKTDGMTAAQVNQTKIGAEVQNPPPGQPQSGQITNQDDVKPLGQGSGSTSQDQTSTAPRTRPILDRPTYRPSNNEGPVTFNPPPLEGQIGNGGTRRPPSNGNQLPNVGDNSGNTKVPMPGPTQGDGKSDERPSPGTPILRADDPGQIDIKISSGKGTNPGTGNEAIRRTGTERMKGGDTQGAADAFDKAAKSGGGGKVHQRRAQAYSSQGKRAEAASAYRDAINAYESDIKNGKGNAESNQAGLNSSRQALRALGN